MIFELVSFLSNGRRARSLRTRPQQRVTMKMVGCSTTEATIKIKHFRSKYIHAFGNDS